MDRKIPFVFDTVEIYKPLSRTNDPNIGHTRVRAFYKYANKNGSYITDEIALYLIETAAAKPVVGFYNHMTKDFEGHSIPELAKAYGYVPENTGFAWENHLDKDGVVREYACFDVVLWVDYWDEATQIFNKAQSMELDRDSIEGDWQQIGDEYYFVYTKAKMKGFCVLGNNKEPCFEGSSFFEAVESSFEKFSMLLMELQRKAEKAQIINKGGKKTMNFKIKGLSNENYVRIFNKLNPNFTEEASFEVVEVIYDIDDNFVFSFNCETKKQHKHSYSISEDGEVTVEQVEEFGYDADLNKNFEDTKASFDTLTVTHDALVAEYATLQDTYNTLNGQFEQSKGEVDGLKAQLTAANAQIDTYSKEAKAAELLRKNSLIKTYEKVLDKEEIAQFNKTVEDFSYDELEAKLAIVFSRNTMKDMEGGEGNKIPKPKPETSTFAQFMERYKK